MLLLYFLWKQAIKDAPNLPPAVLSSVNDALPTMWLIGAWIVGIAILLLIIGIR